MLPSCSGIPKSGFAKGKRVLYQPQMCQELFGSTLPAMLHPLLGISLLELNGLYLLPSKICAWRGTVVVDLNQ